MDMSPGTYFVEGMKDSNKERIAKGNSKAQATTKLRRKVLRGLKKRKDDKLKEEGTTYKAGGY